MEINKELRNFQLRMLDVLTEVDRICRKHDIPYWMSCGTLLGAVRHGGFIPWDDDMDIEVCKKDYAKLLRLLQTELPEQYRVHCYGTDRAFFFQFAKVRDLHSELTEAKGVDRDYKYKGAFLDIFPVEYTNQTAAELSKRTFNFFFKVMTVLRMRRVPGRRLLWPLFHLCLVVAAWFFRVFIHPRSKDCVASLCSDYYYQLGESDLFPLQELTFEGRRFWAPHHPDAYLSSYFGKDYMQLPAEENRIWHGVEFRIW